MWNYYTKRFLNNITKFKKQDLNSHGNIHGGVLLKIICENAYIKAKEFYKLSLDKKSYYVKQFK